MAEKNKSLSVQIGGDIEEYRRALKNLLGATAKLGKDLTKIGKEVTKGITIPIAGFAAAALASSETARVAFARFGSDVKSSMGQIGTVIFKSLNLQGILDATGRGLRSLAQSFAELPGAAQTAITVFGALVAAVGPLIVITGQLVSLWPRIVQGAKLLGTAFTFLATNPLGILISALALAGGAFLLFSARSDTTAERLGRITKSSKEAKDKISDLTEELKRVSDVDSARTRLAEVQEQIRKLSAESQRAVNVNVMGGAAVAVAAAQTTSKLKELRAEETELKGVLDGTTAGVVKQAIGMLEYQQSLEKATTKARGAAVEFKITGDRMKFLESQIDANTTALNKYLETPDPDPAWVRVYTNELKRLNVELTFLKQRREDQKGFADDIRRAAEGAADADTKFRLMGGGVNVVNAQLDAAVKKYQAMKASGASTNAELVKQEQLIRNLQGPMETFKGLMQEIPSIARQIGTLLFDVVQSFSQGVGQAVADAIVFGANLGTSLLGVLKRVAAQVISTLIAMGIQKLIFSLLFAGATASEAASSWASYAGQIYLAAFAATAAIPIVGPALAPGAAAASVGVALAAAPVWAALGAGLGASSAAYGVGGIGLSPQIAAFAEEGPEIALTKRNVREFLGTGRSGSIEIPIYLDRREIARGVVKEIPGALRFHGITV